MVCIESKEIRFFDSMSGDGLSYMPIVLQFLQLEHAIKKRSPLTGNWKMVAMSDQIPKQNNTDDCGVFVCMYAEFSSRAANEFSFKSTDMSLYRKLIAYEILTGELYTEQKL